MKTLSEREAYKAMVIFIEDYWKRTGRGDEIGALLGDLAIVDGDGEPADPAMTEDWSTACRNARSET